MQVIGAKGTIEGLIESGERARAGDGGEGASEATFAIFVFRIGGTRVAIQTKYALSVSDATPPARIPLTPSHVLGLVAYGERVLPILDLTGFFGLRTTSADAGDARQRFVVVRGGGMEVAILATHVEGPREPPEKAVRLARSLGDEPLAKYTTHEVEIDGQLLYVLDLPAVLEAARVRA